MMAKWHLEPLAQSLPRLICPVLLVAGSGDRSIPPAQAEQLQRLISGARVAGLIRDFAREIR